MHLTYKSLIEKHDELLGRKRRILKKGKFIVVLNNRNESFALY